MTVDLVPRVGVSALLGGPPMDLWEPAATNGHAHVDNRAGLEADDSPEDPLYPIDFLPFAGQSSDPLHLFRTTRDDVDKCENPKYRAVLKHKTEDRYWHGQYFCSTFWECENRQRHLLKPIIIHLSNILRSLPPGQLVYVLPVLHADWEARREAIKKAWQRASEGDELVEHVRVTAMTPGPEVLMELAHPDLSGVCRGDAVAEVRDMLPTERFNPERWSWVVSTVPPAKECKQRGMFPAAAFRLFREVLALPLAFEQRAPAETRLRFDKNNRLRAVPLANERTPRLFYWSDGWRPPDEVDESDWTVLKPCIQAKHVREAHRRLKDGEFTSLEAAIEAVLAADRQDVPT